MDTPNDGEIIASAFPESDFERHEWDRDGILSEGKEFFLHSEEENGGETTLDELERKLGTASMVTRWRQAHPDLVGTEKDCVKEMVAEIRRAMGAAENENAKLKISAAAVLLLFKRR